MLMNRMRRLAGAVLGSAILATGIVMSSGAFAAVNYVAPSHTAVMKLMARANEVAPEEKAGCTGPHCEHLHPMGKAVVVPDGHGGWLTAIPAVRWPTADGYGQLVLFWHNKTFVGTDALTPLPNLGNEAFTVGVVRAGKDTVVLKYARYKSTDPMCCPSLPPVKVAFHWNGTKVVASEPVPADAREKNLRFVLVK
jgi:hypothetical protein